MRLVISQSMYFPWVGFLEQLRLAEIFVVYDDVQYSKGSFANRVQIKTSIGSRWLTVPLRGLRLGQRIDEVQLDEDQDWRVKHRDQLRHAYQNAPFKSDMLDLVDSVFEQPIANLAELAHASTIALAEYFDLTTNLMQYDVNKMGINGHGSQRVLDIARSLGATVYITGHGARNYLDHQAFENAGIDVRYMDYRRLPYPQQHGAFNPYVSALDLVANCGREGVRYIQSTAIEWRKFINEPT